MSQTVAIGVQDFSTLIENGYFYIDKTDFIREWWSSGDIKYTFEKLLRGESIICEIDEQIVYNLLSQNEDAIWSLLLASGYLKVQNYTG